MFDLNIFPLSRQEGQEQAEMPELYAVTPPRRTGRGRESDRLILYLELAGNAPLSPEQHRQLMGRLAEKFYKTKGSVTAAMRSSAEALNVNLLERNLRITSSGQQSVGLFTLAVLRGDIVYLAHCGPVHSFLVTGQGTQHFHDPQGAGRGLGLSRTTPIRFYQAQMQVGDFLVLSARPPASFTESSLRQPPRLGMDGMRRQLIDLAGQDLKAMVLKAAIIQAQPGDGKLRLLRRKVGVPDMAVPEVSVPGTGVPGAAAAPSVIPREGGSRAAAPSVIPREGSSIAAAPGATPREVSGSAAAPGVVRQEESSFAAAPGAIPREEEAPAVPAGAKAEGVVPVKARPEEVIPTARPAAAKPEASAPATRPEARPEIKPKRQRHSRTPAEWLAPMRGVVAAFGRALGNTFRPLGGGLANLLKNMLPDEGVLHLPSSVMVFFALAVPLVIGVVGGMVYVQRGRAAQHQLYYEQAYQSAQEASQQTEPNLQRAAWQKVLDDLEQAEFYKVTPDSQALGAQARKALDDMDGVIRLGFQPAIIGGMGKEVSVEQMVATASDLYMLNGTQGSVMRAILTGSGYEMDPSFNCGPSYGPTIIGALVDIVALPKGEEDNATVLGMDANGNLLYCIPGGKQPKAEVPAPPLTDFGAPKAIALDGNDFYVLDPKVNAVWIYRGMDFTQQPRLFFDEEVPPMQDVIDLAVNGDDLFLLHADGHVTQCVFSWQERSPTRCTDPLPYQDPRPGRQDGAILGDSVFSQMYFSPPPDPSIYMLDPAQQAIVHFSMRLAFQRQFRPLEVGSEARATAFAVSPNRLVFLALGNTVYYAAMP